MNVLDTSALIEIARDSLRGGAIVQRIRGSGASITAVTAYEFAVGIRNGYEDQFLKFFDTINLDQNSAIVASQIFHELKKKGVTLGTSDLLIAGICKDKGATLHTLDSDFKKIQGLNVVQY